MLYQCRCRRNVADKENPQKHRCRARRGIGVERVRYGAWPTRNWTVSEIKPFAGEPVEKQQAMWAKIGDGSWYAIPPVMAESFRKAGAEVRLADDLTR